AFQVTVDVPEIYMQEFWAMTKLRHNSIRFKMDTKKSVLNLEAFREMLHISPRIPNQSFTKLPSEEEILEFLRDDVLFYTIKVVSRHQTTQQYGAILPIELTTDEIRNSKAYKEYYACATGEAAPKPKASSRKKKGDYASSTTPPTLTPTTTVVSAPRLSGTAKGTDEGNGSRPGVPDVPYDDSEEELSWNFFDDEEGDEQTKAEKRVKETRLMKVMTEVSESEEESDEEETRQEEEESFDPIPRTPEGSEDESNDEEDQELRLSEEARIQEEEEPDGPQESSYVSSFVTSMLKPISDAGVESIFTTASSLIVSLQTPTPIMTPSTIATITTSTDASIPPPTIPSIILENLLMFNSAFHFDERLRSLETTFFEYRQTNLFVDVVSAIPGIVHQYMTQQMTEAVREAVQIQTDRLQDLLQRENDEFLRNINENMKKIIKGQVKSQVKEQVSRILPRIEESVNATLEAEVLTRSSHSSRTSYAIAADLLEMELKKILIEKMEGNKREDDDQEGPSAGSDRGSKRQKEGGEHASAITLSKTATGSTGRTTTGSQSRQLSASADDQLIVQTSQHPKWFSQPRRPPSPDHDWNKNLPATQGDAQSWISDLARQTDACSSFNKLLDTPIDFSNFIMNRLNVDTLTPKLMAGLTYELMRGSCTSLTELEYHLEEVYKATTDQLDWVNPEATDRLQRHALWEVSHWGRKRQQFYGYAVNQESALDVYSKRRIIAVTELKIVEWHEYKHLDWISVRHDDDQIYKFKEGDFKRLRLQDIEDMLLLLKRLNLTKPDTYRTDLRRREAYTAYSNPRGFIYQNKDKKNRLMWINELHKFSDGTLNDVRNALDDRLKGIQMQYLPTTIWRRGDKDRAATMIQAIEKMLKTRRIMRSLEKFVGGRLSLKKYGFESCDLVDTPMVEKSKLDGDKEGKAVDPSHYRAFAYADHAGCQDTCRSTSESVQFLGERPISWSSKRKKGVAISSTEAEYIALSGCCA
nr:retrovirus-related Pol polyprotein from transposon TNT 1-94 [Tanacetum cinerariifolium]